MSGSFLQRLRHFDAYPKPLEDFRVKTFAGALITFLCTLSVCFLFYYEWRSYMTIEVDQELFVDMSRNQKLTINLNMTFPRLPCPLLSLDVMDASGDSKSDVVKGLKKVRLNKDGQNISDYEPVAHPVARSLTDHNETALNSSVCLSCYGAEASNYPCCNTCSDVRSAYRQKGWHFSAQGVEQCKKELEDGMNNLQASDLSRDTNAILKLLETGEGCQLAGHLEVNKVAGNFHIAPGISFQQNNAHYHDIKHMPLTKFNTKHFFNTFSFGDEYPNQVNPLELKSLSSYISPSKPNDEQKDLGSNIIFGGGFIDINDLFGFLHQQNHQNENPNSDTISFSYFLKIVPTTYEYLDGRIVNNTYQYSVTKSTKVIDGPTAGGKLPGVFVMYELSPIMVRFIEKSKPFSHFLTSCCAIIGGLFTIAGMFDAFTYRYYNMYKKYQINKLT